MKCRYALIFAVANLITAQAVLAQAGSVNTSGVGTSGVVISSSSSYPDIDVKTGNATSAAFRVFNSDNVELLRVISSGNFGIGTTTPTARLEVAGKFRAVGTQSATLSGNATDYYGGGRQHQYNGPLTTIYGTPEGDGAAYTYGAANTESTYYVGGKAGAYVRGGNGFVYAGGGAGIVAVGGDALSGGGSNAEGGAGIYARGGLNAVGTRTYAGYFAGDVVVTGNIGAKYQDVAEWVPAAQKLSAGTVVVLDRTHPNQVMPSLNPYDTTVAGVVSAQPGLILGEAGESKAMVATTGRVRIRVDASQYPIAIGDLLVTSGKPGVAMKSIPVELQGVAIHRPGTVIGKALEPLGKGEGEILVLLSLQ